MPRYRNNNSRWVQASAEDLVDNFRDAARDVAYQKTQASLNTLARMVAGENLAIVVKPDAPTAAFDLQTRTLILPTWQNFSKDIADSLRGHEVAHALYTPAEGWHSETGDKAKARGVKFPVLWANCLNVAEDTRIEKLLKEFLPGYRSVMSRAYAVVFGKVLESEGMTVQEMLEPSVLNRINYVAKVGRGVADCLKTDAERLMSALLMEPTTWEEVVKVAEKLYDLCLADAQNLELPPEMLSNLEAGKGEAGEGESGEGGEESDGDGNGEGEGDDSRGEGGEDELSQAGDSSVSGLRFDLESNLDEVNEGMGVSLENFADNNFEAGTESGKAPRFVPKKVLTARSLIETGEYAKKDR
jgi:hypothetical protein